MLSLLSKISRPTQTCIWTSSTRLFSCHSRANHPSSRGVQEEAALERRRQKECERLRHRYKTDPVYRQSQIEKSKKANRTPETRLRSQAYHARYHAENRERRTEYSARYYNENLAARRGRILDSLMTLERLHKEKFVWKTHTPIIYPQAVDHHCTSCDRVRLLKKWWREKSPEVNRYMCSRCFANSWELVVPESCTGKLPLLFTSPTHPPTPARSEEPKTAQKKGKKAGESEKPYESPEPPQ